MQDWSFRFNPSIPAPAIAVAMAASVLAIAWSYKKVAQELGPARAKVLLALRLSAFAMVGAILLGPTLRTYVWEGLKGRVAIIADDSASMAIPDSARGRDRRPRGEALKEVLSGRRGLIAALSQTSDVKLFAMASSLKEIGRPEELTFSGETTDFAGAFRTLLGMSKELAAAVILSDGTDTAGGLTGPVLAELAAAGIPIFAVAFGGAELVDLDISDLKVSRLVRKDTLVRVNATIRRRGTGQLETPVRLLEISDGGNRERLIAEQRLSLQGAEARAEFEFLPAESGFREYAIEVPTLEGESIVQNNRREFALTVERRKIRVLYMEGTEYRRPDRKLWEFQYLQEALEEDGDIEVTCLLRKDVSSARQAGIYTVQDPERGFPRTKKELFQYDVIISSDIDIDFFTREQLENTVEFVAKRGGGFAMVGGWTAFGPGGYDESVIDKLLPVDMTGRFDGYVENEEFRPVVTEEGLRHPVMRLDPDPERNRAIWERVPYFYGHNKVQRAKPAATVLAYHPEDRNLYGPNVILAVQEYGRGRSLAMTTDTTAGWGTSFEEEFGEDGDNRYYRKFWQNAVRWLAEYRLNAPSRPVQLEVGRNLVGRGEREKVFVYVLGEDYEPMAGAEVSIVVGAPDGSQERILLHADASGPGRYSGEILLDQLGRYTLRAEAFLKGYKLGEDAVSVSARLPLREFEKPEADHGFLRKLASATGGKFYTEEDASRASEGIGDALRAAKRYEERPLWNSPILLAALLALLSVEWFLRKKSGMP